MTSSSKSYDKDDNNNENNDDENIDQNDNDDDHNENQLAPGLQRCLSFATTSVPFLPSVEDDLSHI